MTLYTVPAGRTLIIRELFLCNLGASTTIALTVNDGGGGGDLRWWAGTVAASPNTSYLDVDSLVFNPGDVLKATAGALTPVHCTAFGALLDGAPT